MYMAKKKKKLLNYVYIRLFCCIIPEKDRKEVYYE